MVYDTTLDRTMDTDAYRDLTGAVVRIEYTRMKAVECVASENHYGPWD